MSRYAIKYAEWGWREYLSIFTSSYCSYKPKLSSKISTIYPNSNVILLNSARGGLSLIINQLLKQFPNKTEVIIPSYICPSVTDILSQLGVTIVLAPVGDDLNIYAESVGDLIGPYTLAVLAVHMYGCPVDMKEIQRVCDAHEVVLIDDAAQLGVDIPGSGCPGSYGDFGLISFAQSKTIVAGVRGSGGVLLINKPKWKSLFVDVVSDLSPVHGRLLQFFYFLGEYQFATLTRKFVYYLQRLGSKLNFPIKDYYVLGTISNMEAGIAYHQYQSVAERIRLKCKLLELYKKELDGCPMIEVPQIKASRYLTRLFIQVNLNEENYGRLRAMLRAKGVGTRNGYPDEKRLMELPLSSKMKPADVGFIALALKHGMRCLNEDASF